MHLLVRDTEKGARTRVRIHQDRPDAQVHVEVCDVGELAAVRAFAADFAARVPELDLLVHNAGSLPAERAETSEGNEITLAVHVLGPSLLTELLVPALESGAARSGADSRVLFVASGGMYAQKLHADDLQYRHGTEARRLTR